MDKTYLNRQTAEITEDHRTAVGWYRSGAEVEIWISGHLVFAWEF